MSAPHYFIAVSLQQTLKKQLAQWQKELMPLLPYKQWTHAEDLHLTLKFLGPVPEKQLERLMNELHSLEEMISFEIELNGVGYFGNPEKPRVFFADVHKTDALEQLQRKTDRCAENASFEKEKRTFRPHITLAKKWNGISKQDLRTILDRYQNSRFVIPAKEVVIYKIHPSNLPKYEKYATFQLRKEARGGWGQSHS